MPQVLYTAILQLHISGDESHQCCLSSLWCWQQITIGHRPRDCCDAHFEEVDANRVQYEASPVGHFNQRMQLLQGLLLKVQGLLLGSLLGLLLGLLLDLLLNLLLGRLTWTLLRLLDILRLLNILRLL